LWSARLLENTAHDAAESDSFAKEPSRRVAEKIGMRHERDLQRANQSYWLFTIDAPVSRPA
jgi:hypothetical protein